MGGGIETEADYPYRSGTTSRTGSCKADSSEFRVKVGDTTAVASGGYDEDNLLQEIQNNPISICVDAEPWQWYFGGVVTADTCSAQLDHCVHLVGYKNDGADSYWIVKNSWDTDWGESGYIRLSVGENTCGVAEDATTVEAGEES